MEKLRTNHFDHVDNSTVNHSCISRSTVLNLLFSNILSKYASVCSWLGTSNEIVVQKF